MCDILVAVENYPDLSGSVGLMYVHVRNVQYVQQGLNVWVLNFNANEDYIIDGIQVYTEKSFKSMNKKYDLLIMHAANIKNHLRFFNKYKEYFELYVFFYHGHEVMRVNHEYAKPYPFVKKNVAKCIVQDVYDSFKLTVWRHVLKKNIDKCYFFFVSNWMKNVFEKNVQISQKLIAPRSSIVYNGVGEMFEKSIYQAGGNKKYDFVTIRGLLDNSKYAVDVVNRLAKNTPKGRFLLIGKGTFFDHYEKADNIVWESRYLSHNEIVDVLNQSRFALMPTRTDAQGLMTCEMAALGIPVITSNIDVCHEVFDGFENVSFIDNDDMLLDLNHYLTLESLSIKDTRYYKRNTIQKEIDTIKELLSRQ